MLNKRGRISKFSPSNFLPENRRGQGLSVNVIILLILGLVILVVMIWGFMTGWSYFKDIISPTNVDSLVEDCASVCNLNQEYSFCSVERNLRVNEENLEVKTSCAVLSGVFNFAKYKVAKCPSITCDLSCEDIVIDEKSVNNKKGVPSASSVEGKYDVSSLATTGLTSEQKCIIN